MVGSYCFVEKVSVFNPRFPGKTAKTQRGARRGADTGAKMSGHSHMAQTQIKHTLLQSPLIVTASVCFDEKNKEPLVKRETVTREKVD